MISTRRYLAIVPITVLAVMVWTQAWLPGRVEKAISQGLMTAMPAKSISIGVSSVPALKLLLGHVDRLAVTMGGIQADPPIKSVEFTLDDIRFDPMAAVQGKPLDSTLLSVGGGSGKAVVTEAALNSHLAGASGPGAVTIRLEAGEGIIRGVFRLGGREVELSIHGRFITQGTVLKYVPQGLTVMNTEVPGFIVDEIAGQVSLDIPLGEIPKWLKVTGVTVGQGELALALAPALESR